MYYLDKTKMQTNMRRTFSVLRSLRHVRFPYVASLKSFELNSSWVPEVFLACGGNFRCRPKAETMNRETALEKSLAPRVGQGFESRTSMNFFWLSFATAKNCVKNAMIFFHIIQLTLLKVFKNFRGERFCRAPLGQMFNSRCISCTIYNMHSRDWRSAFTIL